MQEDSIAKKVNKWINQRPYLIYALKKDLINFSSLSREIQKDINVKNFDAVIVAIRRYQKSIPYLINDRKIKEVLEKSSIEIKTGTNVYVIKNSDYRKNHNISNFHMIQGSETITLITQEKMDIKTITKWENVIEVKIKSPETVETTPGVVDRIYSAISEKGLNILETYSCYKETFLVFAKKDMTSVVETLESIGVR